MTMYGRLAGTVIDLPAEDRLRLLRELRRPERAPVEGLLELAEADGDFDRWSKET